MSKRSFVYSPYTNTIRLMPENFCVSYDCHPNSGSHHWVLDMDAGINLRTVLYVAKTLHEVRLLRFQNGVHVAEQLNAGIYD